jgi:hypothetical protein
MYQKDFILRMIELFGEFLAAIMGLIRKGEYTRASEKIGRVYYDMLKEDASFFRSLPENDLTKTLLENHNYTNGHLEILAELFNAEAELSLAQGNKSGSLEFSRKSLILFEFVDSDQKTYSLERLNKIETIRQRIENLIQNVSDLPTA